jgi:hypothetical protein
MASSGATRKPFALPLGFNGIVRVRALPKITMTLSPFTSATVSGVASRLNLRGQVSNLKQPIDCTVRWLLAPDGSTAGAPPPWTGTAEMHVVPDSTTGTLSNKGFAIKEKASNQSPLLDVLALGLYAKGSLGCEVELDLPDRPVVKLEPSGSGLSVDTLAGVDLLVGDGDALAPGAPLRVGSKLQVRPKFAPLFNGKDVQLKVQEAGKGYADEKGTAQVAEWTLGASNETRSVRVGCVTGGTAPRFDFRASGATELRYEFTLHFMQSGAEQANAQPVRGVLATLPKPRLLSFDLSLDPEPSTGATPGEVLTARGAFVGFDPALEFPVEVTLCCRYVLDGSIRHQPVAELGDSAAIKSTKEVLTTVSENRFVVKLLDLGPPDDPIRKSLSRGEQFSFFAVVRLPPTVASRAEKIKDPGRSPHAVFADLIEYDANEGDPAQLGRFCPVGERYARPRSAATGVCSHAVDLAGQTTVLGYDGGLRFTPNSDAVNTFKKSTFGKHIFETLKRPFATEIAAVSQQAQKDALARLANRFQSRIELYSEISAITGTPAEMIAALHVNEDGASALALRKESGFGIDPVLHPGGQCNSVLGRYSTRDGVGATFTRGSATVYADIFQAGIIAAEIMRDDAKTAGVVLPAGAFDSGDLSANQLAAMIAAYASGPATKAARDGLSTGANFMFSPSDGDPRVFSPGSGRLEGRIRWDVLLPVLQEWVIA